MSLFIYLFLDIAKIWLNPLIDDQIYISLANVRRRSNSFPNSSSGTLLVSQHGQLIVSCPSPSPHRPGTPGGVGGGVKNCGNSTCVHSGHRVRARWFDSCMGPSLLCSTYYYYSFITLECHLRDGRAIGKQA